MTLQGWMDDLEEAIQGGAWRRALRLLDRVERGGSPRLRAGEEDAWARRVERLLDRVAVQQGILQQELKTVRAARRVLASARCGPSARRQVDRRA